MENKDKMIIKIIILGDAKPDRKSVISLCVADGLKILIS